MNKILITGTSRGIGSAIKSHFIKKGDQVVGISRTKIDNQENYFHHNIDLSKINELSNSLKPIIKYHNDINILILNAGFGIFKEIDQFSEDEIFNVLNVNLYANIIICKLILPILRQQKNSKIIFLGSESALSGQAKGTIYCASKFGLRGFALSLMQELRKNLIQVSIINPGFVKTNFFDNLNFTHNDNPHNYININEIIKIIELNIELGNHCLIEEINLQPYKKVIIKK